MTRLLLADDVVFSCQRSGACCRGDSLIGVHDATALPYTTPRRFVDAFTLRPVPTVMADRLVQDPAVVRARSWNPSAANTRISRAP